MVIVWLVAVLVAWLDVQLVGNIKIGWLVEGMVIGWLVAVSVAWLDVQLVDG